MISINNFSFISIIQVVSGFTIKRVCNPFIANLIKNNIKYDIDIV